MDKDHTFRLPNLERYSVEIDGTTFYVYRNRLDGKFFTARRYGYYETSEEAINEIKQW